MWIMGDCVNYWGTNRYVHTPTCCAVKRLTKRLGRSPSRAEVRQELARNNQTNRNAIARYEAASGRKWKR